MAVAMSGGVDSSMAAALCVEAGYDVVGIMLRLWSEPGAAGANKCCTAGAIDDARSVADRLDIPFTVLDASSAFKAIVVDPWLQRSAALDTPNPCFTCNLRVRFGYLLERAVALGADSLATGHYARTKAHADGTVSLRKGRDPDKDQSYVLHRLGQDALRRAVFPLGEMTKVEVRAEAAARGLHVAARPDSVDLCWVGADGAAGFLDRHLPAETAAAGPIVDESGRRVGQHRGLARYTIGQRRGIGVALGAPAYVIGRDTSTNTLVIGGEDALMMRQVRVADVHWIRGAPPSGPARISAKIRYRAPGADATWTPTADGAEVMFDQPQRAPTPGQGLVVYAGDEVLGGGTICEQGVAAGWGG